MQSTTWDSSMKPNELWFIGKSWSELKYITCFLSVCEKNIFTLRERNTNQDKSLLMTQICFWVMFGQSPLLCRARAWMRWESLVASDSAVLLHLVYCWITAMQTIWWCCDHMWLSTLSHAKSISIYDLWPNDYSFFCVTQYRLVKLIMPLVHLHQSEIAYWIVGCLFPIPQQHTCNIHVHWHIP